MVSGLRSRLTYSNVVATAALFVALGGSSFAAIRVSSKQIANNSVRSVDVRNNDLRSRDIRDGAVTSRDVLNSSLTGADLARDTLGSRQVGNLLAGDFAPGQLPEPLPDALPSGKTLRGVFGGTVTGGPGIARLPVSFAIPLRSDPEATYVQAGTGAPPQCPGSAADPRATPGNLCLYESSSFGTIYFRGTFHPVTGDNFRSSRFGALLFINGEEAASVRGTWAVTAP